MRLSNVLSVAHNRGIGALASAGLQAVRAATTQRLLGRRYVSRRVHDYQMLLDLEDRGISRTLLLFGEREAEHRLMLQRVLRPGMTVLDIGANIGYYALMELSLVRPNGTVIAAEPSPSNVELLRRNLALNGYHDVAVHQVAVSDHAGTATFHLAAQSNLNTFHPTGTGRQHLTGRSLEVRTVTVPDLVGDGPQPDLIRMDVEGHEVEVLRGMLPAIAAGDLTPPMILFETHLSRYGTEHDIASVLDRYFALGYGVPLLGSSSQRGTTIIRDRGYRGSSPIRTDDVEREIFEDVDPRDAVDFISRVGGARTVLLAPL